MATPFSYKNDEDQDSRMNPLDGKQTAQDLKNAEEDQQSSYDRDFAGLTSPDNLKKDGVSGELGRAESEGSWRSNYSGNKTQAGKVLTAANVKAIIKKRGIWGLIGVIGLGGGILASTLFAPGILLIQMKESVFDKFNTQLASAEVRSNKILNLKIQGTTTGLCAVPGLPCKYTTMSAKQVELFKAAGIEIDSGTATIFGDRVKPGNFKFGDKIIPASEFENFRKTDPKFNQAVEIAHSPKQATVSDKIWSKVASYLGISKQRVLVTGDADTMEESLNDNVKNGKQFNLDIGVNCDGDTCTGADGEQLSAEDSAKYLAAQEEAQAATTSTGRVATETIDEGAQALAAFEAGNATAGVLNFVKVTGVVDDACQIYTSVRGLGYAAKTVRAIQLARYAMIFMNTADQIRNGTATPEDVAYLGGILTSIAYDVKSGAKRKAAMDSAGMKYAMYGETGGFLSTNDSYISQFMAGGGLAGDLIAMTDYVNAATLGKPKETCAVLGNPVVQTVSVIGGIALLFLPPVRAGLTATKIAGGVTQAAVMVGVSMLPALMKDIVAGTVTNGIVGEDSGNAIPSGFGTTGSLVARAGGNAAMSIDDAVEYAQTQNTVTAQYAQAEKDSLSPFDASSKYTFVGSIVSNLMPYTSNISDVSSAFTAIGSIVSHSFGTLIPSSSALTTKETKAAYSLCSDPDYRDMGIATDPFCNVIYGIPPKYLQRDPLTVVAALEGQYDPQTYRPIANSDYEHYVKTCIESTTPLGSGGEDGTEDEGRDCPINDSNANYYLFYIDRRMDENMDGYATETANVSAKATLPLDPGYRTSVEFSSAHKGKDMFFVGGGQPVYAVMAGKVIESGKGNSCATNNVVTIQHTDGTKTGYMHMNGKDILVAVGDEVTAGQQIGAIGNCGEARGYHLHFEVRQGTNTEAWINSISRVTKYGQEWLNPIEYMQHYGVSL